MNFFRKLCRQWFDQAGPECVGLEAEPWLEAKSYPLLGTRYLTVDLETDGLDLKKNRVLSIGAVRVDGEQLHYRSSFYRLLRHRGRLRDDSLLIHGLMPSELAKAEPSTRALRDLCVLGEQCVWVGFHAGFDAQLLQNAFRDEFHWRARPNIVNITDFLPMLLHEVSDADNTLEYWAAHFKLDASARHHALGDATVTAELLLIVLAKARQANIHTWSELYAKHKSWSQLRYHLNPNY